MQRVGGHKPPLQALANEADRSNILAPGLRSETFRTHLFPAFTVGKELQATRLPLQRLARGKSYPVTAAQLLRLHTGFLAPIHLIKLAKN
jgi:hypothetical protein